MFFFQAFFAAFAFKSLRFVLIHLLLLLLIVVGPAAFSAFVVVMLLCCYAR